MRSALFFAAWLIPIIALCEPRQLLQEGLFEEEANRNLDKASAAYEALIQSFDKDRQYAATALFRLAEIRSKQNRKEEAIALFQRVLTEFGNIEPLAKTSRERIATLGGEASSIGGSSVAMTDAETEEITRLQELVKNSPDLLNSQTDGLTPLGRAAQEGWLRAATFLLDQGADINGPRFYLAPLHHAATKGRKAMVELLINRGADINQMDSTGRTPLQVAAEYARNEVARVLLERGAKPDVPALTDKNYGYSPLITACYNQNKELVRLLLEKKADINRMGWSPNPQKVPTTSLMVAVTSGNVEMITLLLDHGANPNIEVFEQMCPLMFAVQSQSLPLTTLLLERGADPNLSAPIFDAVMRGNEDIVRLLAKKGANLDVKIPSSLGDSALQTVVTSNKEMSKLLLELGASPNIANNQNWTPLHTFLANYPMAGQPQPSQPSPAGIPADDSRPRIRSIGKPGESSPEFPDDFEMAKLLVKYGADINARSSDGSTPLFLAVYHKEPPFEVVEWLLANGADPDIKNNEGHSVAEIMTMAYRLRLEQRIVFPAMMGERALRVFVRMTGGPIKDPMRIDPLAEFDMPPDTTDIISRVFREELQRSWGVPNQFEVIVFRGEKDGEAAEAFRVSWKEDNVFESPVLQWGDVVVLFRRDSPAETFRGIATTGSVKVRENAASLKVREKFVPRKITIQIGDREKVLELAGEQGAFASAPATGKAPEWRFSELVSRATGAEPRAQLSTVKVQRTVDGKLKEWTVDLRPDQPGQSIKELPAQLADGDRVIIPLLPADDVEALKTRRAGIFRTTTDRMFGDQTFRLGDKDDAPRTLGDLILESERRSDMLIPEPDLAKIRIHRLKADDAAEETLQIDLQATIDAITAETPYAEVLKLDVPLKWGDIVEIPAKKNADFQKWRGMGPQSKMFFTRALTREVTIRATGAGTRTEMYTPNFREIRPSTSEEVFLWKVSSPNPHAHARALSKGLGIDNNTLKIRLISGEHVREFSPEEFKRINPWLVNGDRLELERF